MTLPHQGHHLPWDALASHLTYVGGFSARPSRESFLHLKPGPRRHIHDRSERRAVARRAAKDAHHFYRVLAARIVEFAETEGRKIEREVAGAEGGDEEEVLFEWQWDVRPEFKKVSDLYRSENWVPGEVFPYPLTEAVEVCPGNLRSFWRSEGWCVFRADIIMHVFNLDTRESRVGLHRLATGGEFCILSNGFLHGGLLYRGLHGAGPSTR